MDPLLSSWRDWARADAEARGIAGLAPMFDGLAASLTRLRSVDWNSELPKLKYPTPQPPRESGRT